MPIGVNVQIPYIGRPYDKQPGESEKWFSRFQAYLVLGPDRSLAHACRAVGANIASLRNWEEASSKGRWVERVTIYDNELMAQHRTEMEGDRLDMLKRHAEQARHSSELCIKVIQRAVELCDDPTGGLRTLGLTPRTITRTNEETGEVLRVRSEGLLPLLTGLTSALQKMQEAERRALGDEPKVVMELSGPNGGPIRTDQGLTDDSVDAILQRMESVVAARFGDEFSKPEDTTAPESDETAGTVQGDA